MSTPIESRKARKSEAKARNTRPPFAKAQIQARDEFYRAAGAHTEMILAETRAGRYLVPTWDLKVGLTLFRRGARGEQTLLRRALEVLNDLGLGERLAGSTLLEVGANIGTSCISALLTMPFADAVVLEPHPDNCRVLRANAALNDLHERITILDIAASDHDGTVSLALSGVNSGGHRVLAADEASRKNVIVVEAFRLDSLVQRGDIDPARIGLWFMDAQGQEGAILAGAATITRAGTPILVEYKPRVLLAAGGLEPFHAAAAEHYTHVLDLASVRGGFSEHDMLPADRLDRIAERYPEGFTDLLLLRLDRAAAT